MEAEGPPLLTDRSVSSLGWLKLQLQQLRIATIKAQSRNLKGENPGVVNINTPFIYPEILNITQIDSIQNR